MQDKFYIINRGRICWHKGPFSWLFTAYIVYQKLLRFSMAFLTLLKIDRLKNDPSDDLWNKKLRYHEKNLQMA